MIYISVLLTQSEFDVAPDAILSLDMSMSVLLATPRNLQCYRSSGSFNQENYLNACSSMGFIVIQIRECLKAELLSKLTFHCQRSNWIYLSLRLFAPERLKDQFKKVSITKRVHPVLHFALCQVVSAFSTIKHNHGYFCQEINTIFA